MDMMEKRHHDVYILYYVDCGINGDTQMMIFEHEMDFSFIFLALLHLNL